jgi:starvation-inducible DNA-binding protein
MSKVTAIKRAPSNLDTPTDLEPKGIAEISKALNGLLADAFALYLKTKNFHWHVSGPHFRDYHLMLDDHAEAIFATTDELAERVRKIGGTTLRSIGQISKLQSLEDCDEHEDVASASLLENFIDATERRTWFLFEAARNADSSGH